MYIERARNILGATMILLLPILWLHFDQRGKIIMRPEYQMIYSHNDSSRYTK